LSEQIEIKLKDRFGDSILEVKDVFGVLNFYIKSEVILDISSYLCNELGFDYLADITAVDWKDKIEVIYQLNALADNTKIALRVSLDRNKPEVESLINIWKGADFQEREAYDLMGVVFKNHPDLRRILLPDDWEGYPLRKDYVIPD
jgi:NADH-quinone oxidoreductase subunit C